MHVYVDAVPGREQPRHEAAVRGERERDVRPSVCEVRRAGGEGVEVWGPRLGVAGIAEAICPRRVQRDQEDVWACNAIGALLGGLAPRTTGCEAEG